MKKLIFSLSILLAVSSVHADEAKLTGVKAQQAYNDLAGQFEIKSGATVSGLSIETIIRHDNGSISCVKETVKYGEEKAVVTYECLTN